MKFKDKFVFKEEKFSIGLEETTGRYYISIPVSNPYVDYEEYYEISAEQFSACPKNTEELKVIAEKCRARKNDENLLVKPGRLRGAAV